jgi:hypothetical protein
MRAERSGTSALVFLKWLPLAVAAGAFVALVLAAAAFTLASGAA